MTITDTHASCTRRFDELRAELDGTLSIPVDPTWDGARAAWQLLADQLPVAVVEAASVSDVVRTIRAARDLGLRVAPQSTGHAAGAIDGLDDTILLRTARLREVSIDAQRKVARIGAGAQWADVVPLAAQDGLAAVTGYSPGVGVVGFTLGGGLGWLGRSHGLAANSLLAVDAVDATGAVIRIDATHHEDLFWALRGGAAPVVVTAIEVRLYPIARAYGGALMWPLERTAEVVRTWAEWVSGLPASVTSNVRVLRFPPLPELPPFLQGRAFVAVEAVAQEADAVAEAIFAPLRLLEPEIDLARPITPADFGAIHGDPQDPVGAHGDSVLIERLTPAAIERFIEVALSVEAAPLLSIELRHLGAELAPGRGEGGAVADLAGEGLVYAVGVVPFPAVLPLVEAAADRVVAALLPFASPRRFRNFHELPTDAVALYGDAVERLRRITAEWDPEGTVRLGHAVR